MPDKGRFSAPQITSDLSNRQALMAEAHIGDQKLSFLVCEAQMRASRYMQKTSRLKTV